MTPRLFSKVRKIYQSITPGNCIAFCSPMQRNLAGTVSSRLHQPKLWRVPLPVHVAETVKAYGCCQPKRQRSSRRRPTGWLLLACRELRNGPECPFWDGLFSNNAGVELHRRRSTWPVSRPSSISIVVIPVFSSPSIIALFMGAAPRYLGRRDA